METLAQAFTGGWTSGIEMQDASEKSAANTSLLSSQAEAAKIKIDEYKQEQTNKLADQAAITQATKLNSEARLDDIKGIHQVYSSAIEANRDKPEVVERLRKKMYGLKEEYDNSQITRGKAMEAQRQEDWNTVNSGLNNPTASATKIRERATATGNQDLNYVADIFEDKAPANANKFKDAKGKPKMLSELSAQEYQVFQYDLASKVGGKAAQKEQNDLAMQLQRERDMQARLLAAEERIAQQARDNAAKRELTGDGDVAKLTIEANREIKTSRNVIRELEIEQAELKEKYGIQKDLTETTGWFFKDDKMPQTARDRYQLISDQIALEQQGIADQESRLISAGALPVPKTTSKTVSTYQQDKPAKIVTQADFDKLKSGDWFTNPKDGVVMKKK